MIDRQYNSWTIVPDAYRFMKNRYNFGPDETSLHYYRSLLHNGWTEWIREKYNGDELERITEGYKIYAFLTSTLLTYVKRNSNDFFLATRISTNQISLSIKRETLSVSSTGNTHPRSPSKPPSTTPSFSLTKPNSSSGQRRCLMTFSPNYNTGGTSTQNNSRTISNWGNTSAISDSSWGLKYCYECLEQGPSIIS